MQHRLSLSQALATTALERHWQSLDTRNTAWGTLQLVHWQVGRDDVRLHPELDLRVTPQEHQAIEDSIMPLLREDGFMLETHEFGVWHIASDELAYLQCCELARAAGRDMREIQARPMNEAGAAAIKKWHRITNELQMLLYSHPVNDLRAANMQLTLNAVWLSGCGALPSPAPARPEWTHVRVNDVAALEAALTQHEVTTLTLCSADSAVTLTQASLFKRLLKPRVSLQTLAAQL